MASAMLNGRGAPLIRPAAAYCTPFHAPGQGAVDPVREPAVVGELLAGRAFGDNGADAWVGADRGEGLLTAHGLTDHREAVTMTTERRYVSIHRGCPARVGPACRVRRPRH
jgi:hypothetical protein